MSKIQEIQQKIQQEQGARDGLIKMKGVYESNTVLGDPQTVQGELKECENSTISQPQSASKSCNPSEWAGKPPLVKVFYYTVKFVFKN
jgi:hypothetical protein